MSFKIANNMTFKTTMKLMELRSRVITQAGLHQFPQLSSILMYPNYSKQTLLKSSSSMFRHFSSIATAEAKTDTLTMTTVIENAPFIDSNISNSVNLNVLDNNNNSNNSNGDFSSNDNDLQGPSGPLFTRNRRLTNIPSLVGQYAMLRRTFGPRDNVDAMLACGGADLAAHASFDPDYNRAQGWIRTHAVGPAVLSPVLIAGLTGALVEASFPQAIVVTQSMQQRRPLIVGVPVHARIEVTKVTDKKLEDRQEETDKDREDEYEHQDGYLVTIQTLVSRVRDDAVISEGEYTIWIPDYLNC